MDGVQTVNDMYVGISNEEFIGGQDYFPEEWKQSQ